MKAQKTQLKKKADKLFADKVKEIGYCHKCGSTSMLQCAHIISRSYLAIRWNPLNAICLCAGCHLYFTYHPIEWELYIDENFPNRYRELKLIALTHRKPDYAEILEALNGRG